MRRRDRNAPCPALARAGRAMPRATNVSTAGGDLTGLYALAQIGLGDPTCGEDVVQVGGRDWVRGQKDRVEVVSTRGFENRGPADFAWVGVLAELHGRFASGLAEQTRVLPHVDRLRTERDAVQGSLVAVLAGHRHLAREALSRQRGDHAASHTVILREPDVRLVPVRR